MFGVPKRALWERAMETTQGIVPKPVPKARFWERLWQRFWARLLEWFPWYHRHRVRNRAQTRSQSAILGTVLGTIPYPGDPLRNRPESVAKGVPKRMPEAC